MENEKFLARRDGRQFKITMEEYRELGYPECETTEVEIDPGSGRFCRPYRFQSDGSDISFE